jgi:hypothetical protein
MAESLPSEYLQDAPGVDERFEAGIMRDTYDIGHRGKMIFQIVFGEYVNDKIESVIGEIAHVFRDVRGNTASEIRAAKTHWQPS